MQVLDTPVLVLNKSWVVIGTTTVRDALTAIARGAADGLCTDSYQLHDWESWTSGTPTSAKTYIKTTSSDVPAPEIVVLTNYDRLYARPPVFTHRSLYARDGYNCQYCLKKYSASSLTVDHVLPRSRGGPTSWENCVACCLKCNQRKADRTPREAGLKLIKKPEQPRWNPVMHVRESARPESWSSIMGITA